MDAVHDGILQSGFSVDLTDAPVLSGRITGHCFHFGGVEFQIIISIILDPMAGVE